MLMKGQDVSGAAIILYGLAGKGGGARSRSRCRAARRVTRPPGYTCRVTENRRLSLPGLSIVRSEPMRWASSRVK